MKQRSLGVNAMLNTIRTVLAMLFPVMTFWRVSHIFTVDTIGSYSFANAAAGYFLMLAALGISTYAIREGVAFRDDRSRMSVFASEIFTINLVSTFVSYVLLFICAFLFPRFAACRSILLILSVNLILTTLGCDWIHSVYEDFLYITLRTIFVYAFALVLFFLFVRTENDLYTYAWITVLASSGAQLLNIPARRKYCSIRPVPLQQVRQHLRPVLTLFANTVTTSLYVNSDLLILGFLKTDYDLGLYTVAVKIYMLFKALLSAVITAVTPRLSALWAEGDRNIFEKAAANVYHSLLTILMPVAVGLFCLGKNLILILSGEPYLPGISAVHWLCGALVFSLACWFLTACVLIPAKEDKTVLRITLIAALSNIILNFILIPIFGFTAAAVTTLIAEGIVFVLSCRATVKYVSLKAFFPARLIVSVLAGSAAVAVLCCWVSTWPLSPVAGTLIAFVLSVPLYGAIAFLLMNPAVRRIVSKHGF